MSVPGCATQVGLGGPIAAIQHKDQHCSGEGTRKWGPAGPVEPSTDCYSLTWGGVDINVFFFKGRLGDKLKSWLSGLTVLEIYLLSQEYIREKPKNYSSSLDSDRIRYSLRQRKSTVNKRLQTLPGIDMRVKCEHTEQLALWNVPFSDHIKMPRRVQLPFTIFVIYIPETTQSPRKHRYQTVLEQQ